MQAFVSVGSESRPGDRAGRKMGHEPRVGDSSMPSAERNEIEVNRTLKHRRIVQDAGVFDDDQRVTEKCGVLHTQGRKVRHRP